MIARSRSLHLIISLLVVASMAVLTFTVTGVNAAGAHKSGKAACKPVKASGTVKFSDWQFPDTLNPEQTTLLVTTEIIHATFVPMYQFDNHAKLKAILATSVPSIKNGGVKDNGRTIVVHLKHGQHWSTGAEFTSRDIKFSWQIGMDPNSGPVCAGSCDVISRIDTPDKYTAVFHLKHPYAPAVTNAVEGFDLYPYSAPGFWKAGDEHAATLKLYQDTTMNFEGPDYPTNGPYQVAPGGFSNNDRIVLRPMKYYTATSCGAYVKNLIFAFYADKPSLIAAAASNATDVTSDYTAADLPALKQHTNYKTYAQPSFTFEHLELNVDSQYNGKTNPLHNANVRVALALALDKISLIRSALGLSASAAKAIQSWSPWVNTAQLVQPFANKNLQGQWDPVAHKFQTTTGSGQALADAKKLLNSTSYKGGFDLDFVTTSGNPVRQAQEAVIAKDWSRLGVNLKPAYYPASKLFASYDHGGTCYVGAFQVAMFAFTGSPEPDGLKYNLQSKFVDREKSVHSNINSNYSAIHDKLIDRDFDLAANTFNNTIRRNNYYAIQTEINKEAYWIGLYFRPTIATANNHIVNFMTNPTTSPQWNIYAWKAKS